MDKPKYLSFSLNEDGTYEIKYIIPMTDNNERYLENVNFNIPRADIKFHSGVLGIPVPIDINILHADNEDKTIFNFIVPDED